MRGKFLHNQILLGPVATRFEALGATVYREYFIANPPGYVDLLIIAGDWRLACEAEQRVDRIGNDVAKAATLLVDLLVILVPNRRTAASVNRRLRQSPPSSAPTRPPIVVLPLGTLLQRLAHLKTIKDRLNVLETLNPKIRLGLKRKN